MRLIVVGTGVLLPTTHAASAGDAVVLPEVEVTEQRPSEAEQRAPTAFISEVDTTQRDAAIETTADVLQETVGVHVLHYGGLGAFSTISIRGSTSSQVPVYLDGIPLSQAENQSVNLADLPLDSIQHIDVYRGTVPVGFGGGGIGGVVNLVTKPASATPSTDITTGYGSFETRKVVVEHTQQLGGFDVLANVAYLGSQGDFTYKVDNPAQPNEQTTRINNAFNSVGTLLKGTRQLGDGVAFDAAEELFYKDQGVPGQGTLGTAQFTDPSLLELRSLTYLRLRATGLLGGVVDASGSIYGVYNLQEFDDPQGNFGGAEHTHDQTMLVGASNTGTWYAPLGQSIGWFDELAYEEFFPYNATNAPSEFPNSGPDQTRLRTTLAAQDAIALVSDRVQLVPSLRYDHFLDEISTANPEDVTFTSTQTSNLDLWTPAVGVQGRFAPWLTLRANIGRFQRAPSFFELFGNTGTVVGTAGLKPETGINRDAGLIASADAHGWLDHAQLELAYFHNNVDDLIAFTQVSRSQFKAINIGAALLEGEEVTAGGSLFGHLGIDTNYTHQETENRSGILHQQGNPLPLRPADELFAHTELYNPFGKLYYEYTYISSDLPGLFDFSPVPSRSIHTVGLVATPREWLAVKFEAANITNADVRDVGGFPLPGLSFFGSIKVTL